MTKELIEEIVKTLKCKPDITLQEMIDHLSLPIQKSQLNRLIKKFGFSFKKKRYIQVVSSETMFSKSAENGKRGKKI